LNIARTMLLGRELRKRSLTACEAESLIGKFARFEGNGPETFGRELRLICQDKMRPTDRWDPWAYGN